MKKGEFYCQAKRKRRWQKKLKKEAIITVFILVIIFIGEFITQGFTSKYLGDTKIQLENIKQKF